MNEFREVRTSKIGTSHYEVFDKRSGERLGEVALTGRRGVDDYPWDWSLSSGVTSSRTSGVTATMLDAIDQIRSHYPEGEA